ncbi:Protein LYK5 [Ananas comosus]|uniref:Protein LYK5 n=2 Tax=Ananas comosus TaxID=4615 RepID=A0A199UK63_ANACO|nr:Protein LYK5 [Ananas comosus]CAD1831285.1 unnamed protein product [Ananas comosus var. bracteatus]
MGKPKQRQQEQEQPPVLFSLSVFFLCFLISIGCSDAQQEYENNEQDNCYGTNGSSTLGYSCSGGGSRSCTAYLTFRAAAPSYQSPVDISNLLSADAANISSVNGAADASSPLPDGRPVLVPVACACAGAYYQHNATYTLKSASEIYLTVANGTFAGLSTCQALIAQNPRYESHNLSVGLTIAVPLRCACPSPNQTAQGYKYLLTYVVTWGEDPSAIAGRFGVDPQALLDANSLSADSTIYPFTTLLVPLRSEPTEQQLLAASPPPPPSSTLPPPPSGSSSSSSSSNKWVFIGIGIGAGLLILCGILAGLLTVRFRRRRAAGLPPGYAKGKTNSESGGAPGDAPMKRPAPLISSDVRNVIESLAVYEHGELERATGFFGEEHRIKGSVYRGVINGDSAAIKRLKGDVSNEINILKHINHSNVVRLSGFCVHDGDTFLVYEFADHGSLADWLHHHHRPHPHDGSSNEWSSGGRGYLSWKQRVQIAYDVADGLNYLHNYTNPPYIHKNLKSSNILLDAELRAKLSNFGLARAVLPTTDESGESAPQMTRHVVGTQGYMAPEYLEHGLVTPQLDVFAFGVVMLELLSGREAASFADDKETKGGEKALLLWESISGVLGGEDVRRNFRGFVDPYLQSDYPFDLAFAMAELAMRCVSREPGARPSIGEVLVSLSAIYNAASDWDPSDYSHSGSMIHAR